MGYIKHHAIVVTCFKRSEIVKMRKTAKRLFGKGVTGILQANVNEYYTFFIGPDGSKEGWAHSNDADQARADFIAFIQERNKKLMAKSYINYAEFFYGDDNGKSKIITHN